jgi:hypothetical protein
MVIFYALLTRGGPQGGTVATVKEQFEKMKLYSTLIYGPIVRVVYHVFGVTVDPGLEGDGW